MSLEEEEERRRKKVLITERYYCGKVCQFLCLNINVQIVNGCDLTIQNESKIE